MDILKFLENYIRGLDDSQAYLRGQLFIELSKHKSWLPRHGLYASLAWLGIMAGRHTLPTQQVPSSVHLIIHRDEPQTVHHIEHYFTPSEIRTDGEVHDVCTMFAEDMKAICAATGMRMGATVINLIGRKIEIPVPNQN
ncbi:MAG: hypothetical protein WCP91_02190 [Candidatus Berkelbacteria bacterium]